MKRDNRPKGREKRVTSGGGNVRKRGSGIGSGKPVGSSSGYSGRKQSARPGGSQTSGSQESNTGSRSILSSLLGGGSSKKSSGLKKLITIIIIVVVGYFVLSFLFRSCGAETLPTNNALVPENNETVALIDDDAATLDTSVAAGARAKRTVIKGGGDDVFTIMIYMCGTDLESKHGMATADLQEILNADIADNVNIIVETGGTKTWKNDIISNTTNQRYQCTSKGLVLLEKNLGRKTMTEPETLTDFIKYSKSNFPANRYTLIFWDHGGGSVTGYGYDEYAPRVSMDLGEIDDALKKADCDFDFVGFDACLMATFETAIMLDRHSDYLIASEEIEPGIGWYYTDWISALSANTSMSTPEIGKNIIDSFIVACQQRVPNDKLTLSIIDLAEMSGTVPQAFTAFASSTAQLIDLEQYQVVSDARSGARAFGTPSVANQIDLVHLAQNMGTEEAAALVDALNQCIKYNRTSSNIANANGLSIYFPYGKLSTLGPMLSTYDEIGMDEEYSECIKSFANIEAGGQVVSSGTDSPIGSLLGSLIGTEAPSTGGSGTDLITGLLGSFVDGGDFSSILGDVIGGVAGGGSDWIDTGKIESSADYYEDHYLDSADLAPTQKGDGHVLSLTDEQWDLVQTINLNVFFDDGEGFIDLGMDNVFEFDDDDDMIMDYDGTWIAINGQVVSYYFLTEDRDGDDYTITGRVPAMLNGERVNLMLVFTDEDPYGQVAGAQIVYEDETLTAAKGLVELRDGDVIDFLCDYYSYDEEYDDSYYFDDQMIVDGGMEISNVSVGDASCKVTFQLTDIYNNTYWTPALLWE